MALCRWPAVLRALTPGPQVLTEYTRDGVHCRSANLQSGVFECVLPQVFPNMGLLMQDLCDSGVYDVEYHADSHESRFMIYVGGGKLADTLKRRARSSYMSANSVMKALIVLAFSFLLIGIAASVGIVQRPNGTDALP